VAKKEVVTVLRGDSKDIQEAFRKAGTDADQFREKVQRLNQLKLEAKVLKVDTNLSKAEAEIQSLTGSGGKLKGVIGELTQQFLPMHGAVGDVSGALGASTLAAGAMAGGIGALGMVVKSSVSAFVDQATAISKFAQITQTSAKDASDLVNALDDVGISSDTASAVFAKMTKAIPTKAFADLNIEVGKNADGTTDMVRTFGNVLTKLDTTKDATERARIANAVFGKGWTELTAILDKGAEGLQKSLEANKGLQMSPKDLADAKAFKASMDELGDAAKEAQIKLGRIALPPLTEAITDVANLASGFADLVTKLKEARQEFPGWFNSMLGGSDDIARFNGELEAFRKAGYDASQMADLFALGMEGVHKKFVEMGGVVGKSTEPLDDWVKGQIDAIKALGGTDEAFHKVTLSTKSYAQSLLDQMNAEDRSASAASAVASARQRVADQQRAGAEAVRNAEQNLADVRAKAGDLADRTAGAEKNLEKARRDVKSAAEDLATAEAEFTRIANGSTEATDELISATDELSRARESAADAQQRAYDIELEISGQIIDNRLNGPKRVDQANRDLIRSQNRVQDATDRVASIEAELAKMRVDGKSTTAEIARKERDLEEARLDISDATDRVAESQDKLTKAQERAADPAAGTEKLEKDLEKARKDLRDRTTEVADAERVVGDLRNGYAPTTDVYRTAEEKVVAARQSLRDRTDEVKAKEKELFDARTTQAALPGQIATAEAALTGVIQAEAEKQRLAVESVNSALREQEKLRLSNQVASESALGGTAAAAQDQTTNRGNNTGFSGKASQTDIALATIRKTESGNNYTESHRYNADGTKKGADSASGAYQFIDSTWKAMGGSTAHAYQASPAEQDRIARKYLAQFWQPGQDIRKIPKGWIGNASAADGTPIGGNNGGLTYGQYADRWTKNYNQIAAQNAAAAKTAKATEETANAAKGQSGSQKYLATLGQDQLRSLRYMAQLGDEGNSLLDELGGSIDDMSDSIKEYSDAFFAALKDAYSGGANGGSATAARSAAPVHNPLYSIADAQAGVFARGPNGDGNPFARNPILGSTLYDEFGNPIYADDVEAIQRALDRLPRAASGAFVPARAGGQLYQVAEGGQDEIITPVPMMQRIVRDELRRDGGGGGTFAVTIAAGAIVVNDASGDSKKLARTIAPDIIDEITRLQRRRG